MRPWIPPSATATHDLPDSPAHRWRRSGIRPLGCALLALVLLATPARGLDDQEAPAPQAPGPAAHRDDPPPDDPDRVPPPGVQPGPGPGDEAPAPPPPPPPATPGDEEGELRINGKTYHGIRRVSRRYSELTHALEVTQGNGIDEIYLKDSEGNLYLAYGYYSGLDAPGRMQNRYVGSYQGKILEVVHVDNEINTFSEGAFSAWDDLKSIFQPLVEEHFGKALAAGGVAGGMLFFREVFKSGLGLTGPGVSAGLRSFVQVASKAGRWGALAAVAAGIGWPLLKGLWHAGRKLYLESKKNNLHTIAMVTADTPGELHRDVTVPRSQRGELTPGEIGTEIIRRDPVNGRAPGTGTEDPFDGFNDLRNQEPDSRR